MSKFWDNVRTSLSIIRVMEGGDSRHKYSARAAYNFPGFSQGEVLNIDPTNVLCGRQTTERQLWILVATYYISVVGTQVLMFEPATTVTRKVSCVTVGCIGLALPFMLLTLSNRQLLFRILCKSFMPWIKFYLCAVESYSLCSLCSWRWRAFAITPLLLSSQLNVFIADALFYRNRAHTVVLLVLFIIWRIILIVCVRFSVYGELDYSTFEFWGFSFYNSGSFVSKSISLLLFQVGQLIFYIRYKHRLYSIRTSYTVLENKVWNAYERQKRVERRSTRQDSVEEVKKKLSSLEDNYEFKEHSPTHKGHDSSEVYKV